MNEIKNQIIELLSDTGEYVSGEMISNHFGVSRSAIWKHMNQLKEAGYEIESIKHKGYRLLAYPQDFVASEVWNQIQSYELVHQVITKGSIDSTNEEARRLSKETELNLLIIAEEQLEGKGRRGRNWVSKKGTGIYMSLLLHPTFQPIHASKMTLLAGLAVCRAIFTVTGLEVAIKWPNDIVFEGKKLCGILTEMSTELNEISYVVLGIGINVNDLKMGPEIESIATSLALACGKTLEKKLLLTHVISEFTELYNEFCESNSLSFMIEEYNKCCITVGSAIQIMTKDVMEVGNCIQVLEDGGLNVLIEGKERVIQSGEVSVRGLYGYVDSN